MCQQMGFDTRPATTVDPCTVAFDADDKGDDMEIDDSNNEIVSDSEDDSVSEKKNRKLP